MTSVSVSSAELDSFHTAIVALVKAGGAVIKDAINKEKKIEEKASVTDLVTETDQAVEKMLFDGLRSQFPDHHFIGEESTAAAGENAAFPNAPTWIIDPVDGTMNFVHSNHNVCISVGLAVNRKIEIGIVYLPMSGDLYTARKGQGAFKNGEKIHVSPCAALNKSMAMVEFWSGAGTAIEQSQISHVTALISRTHAIRSVSSCDRLRNAMILQEAGCRKAADVQARKVEQYIAYLNHGHSVRQYGSAAIALCMVASGQADIYVQCGMHSWDVVAGGLIVREAGGVMLDPSGGDFDFMSRRVMASSSGSLAKEMVALGLKQLDFERDHPDVCLL